MVGFLENQTILHGGQSSENENYLAPTLLEISDINSAVMQDEIFGPILPILVYNNELDISKIIDRYEKPLALYVFTRKSNFAKQIIQKFSFGGGCVNDTMVQFINKRLPFGGVGHSGIEAYHGKRSFDLFSHQKSIVKKANWLDVPLRYAPYSNKLAWVAKILKYI